MGVFDRIITSIVGAEGDDDAEDMFDVPNDVPDIPSAYIEVENEEQPVAPPID